MAEKILPAVPALYASPKLVYDMAQRIQVQLDIKLGWLEKSYHIAKIGINADTELTYPQIYNNDGTNKQFSVSPDKRTSSYSFIEEDNPPNIDMLEGTIEYFLSIVFWNNLELVDSAKMYDFTSELMMEAVDALSIFSAEEIKTEIRPEKIFDKYTETKQELKQFLLKPYAGFKLSFSVLDGYPNSCGDVIIDSCQQNIDRINNLPASVKTCVLAAFP